MTTKTCTRCKECRPVDKFQFRSDRGGYYSICKDCRNSGRRKGCATAPKWTPAESAIVRDNYASMGAGALMAMLPGRTFRSIKAKAERDGYLQPVRDYTTHRGTPWKRPYEPLPEWAQAADLALRNYRACNPAANLCWSIGLREVA